MTVSLVTGGQVQAKPWMKFAYSLGSTMSGQKPSPWAATMRGLCTSGTPGASYGSCNPSSWSRIQWKWSWPRSSERTDVGESHCIGKSDATCSEVAQKVNEQHCRQRFWVARFETVCALGCLQADPPAFAEVTVETLRVGGCCLGNEAGSPACHEHARRHTASTPIVCRG